MCSLCYPEDFFSGLHKDTGVHASSIPTTARLIFHMEIRQVQKTTGQFVAGVRGKAGFTHNMDKFGRDVCGKRFSTHGTHEKQIDNRMEGRGK